MESIYRVKSERLFSPEGKQPWACLLEVQDCERSGGHFLQEKKPWARLLDVQAFQKSRAYLPWKKTHQRWARPCSGLQKIQSVFFFRQRKTHSLEHARWTFRASRKSNSAKIIFYCKATKTIFNKQLSCAAQITQGTYTDVACCFHPKTLSLRTQD